MTKMDITPTGPASKGTSLPGVLFKISARVKKKHAHQGGHLPDFVGMDRREERDEEAHPIPSTP